MSLVDDLLEAASRLDDQRPSPDSVIRWGKVRQASGPLKVQFAGDADTAGTTIKLKASDFTPVLNDMVVLLRVGRVWLALCDYGAAP